MMPAVIERARALLAEHLQACGPLGSPGAESPGAAGSRPLRLEVSPGKRLPQA